MELKRELLIIQIRKIYDDYIGYREEFSHLFRNMMKKLNQTYIEMGKNHLNLISKVSTIQYKPKVNITFTKDIGTITTNINYKLIQEEDLPAYSFEHTSFYLDELIITLKYFFEMIILLAEKEDSILNFSFNFKKINRRINGLENIILPNLQSDIIKIKQILEESERESFVRLKKTKQLIAKKQNVI